MDLSTILPAHIAVGVLLLRRRRLGYALAPVLLGFGILMSLSIAGMLLVMRLRGAAGGSLVVIAMLILAALNALVLTRTLRALRAA